MHDDLLEIASDFYPPSAFQLDSRDGSSAKLAAGCELLFHRQVFGRRCLKNDDVKWLTAATVTCPLALPPVDTRAGQLFEHFKNPRQAKTRGSAHRRSGIDGRLPTRSLREKCERRSWMVEPEAIILGMIQFFVPSYPSRDRQDVIEGMALMDKPR